MKIVGLMSGTSADGIDAALVEIRQHRGKLRCRLIAFHVLTIPSATKKKIFQVFRDGKGSVSLACQLNFEMGELFAQAASRVIRKAGLQHGDIDAIGSHGQTIFHIPPGMAQREGLVASTLQVGDAAVIGLKTGITTVADFRTADMAVGGEGAPLIPFVDFHLLSHPRLTRVVQNIGGIANCTLLPAASSMDNVIAFDTGPGNMIIDALVAMTSNNTRHFDRNGALARKGRVDKALLRNLLTHFYFETPPPKTTGRETFGVQYAERLLKHATRRGLSLEDTIATATALTAESIAHAYERFVFPHRQVDEVILGGGGAKNSTLVAMLRDRLPRNIRLLTHEDVGIDSKAKEALGFAMLAYACLKRKPSNVPSATGAQRPVILGKIYTP